MTKKLLIFITLLAIFLSGCTNIAGSKLKIENRELRAHTTTPMILSLNYNTYLKENTGESFTVQFVSGKHLEIRKSPSGNAIQTDAIFDVKKPRNITYYVYANWIQNAQEVETVEVIITSNNRKITEQLTSDFILITN
jgi:hypothetical protein